MSPSALHGLAEAPIFEAVRGLSNPASSLRPAAPYVVVLSSELIDLPSALVAPLITGVTGIVTGVDLAISFGGAALTLPLMMMAQVAPARLRHPLGTLITYEYEIRRGLDRLFTGF